MSIAGETETFEETLRLIPIIKPRIVVLDIHLRDFETIKPFDFCAQSGYHCDGISIFTDDETETLAKKTARYEIYRKGKARRTAHSDNLGIVQGQELRALVRAAGSVPELSSPLKPLTRMSALRGWCTGLRG
jgi:hypothetical protein